MASLLDSVKDAGVVGAGGAGFPAHVKLDCKVEYLLVNAAECEPLLATDKYLLNAYPGEIVEAAAAVAEHVSADKVRIAIKAVNEKEVASVRGALARLGSKAEIFPLDNYYPAGDEQMIVYDVTGRVVPPGGIPLNVGAVVSNASTMWNIYHALRGRPVTHKFLTVAGEVARPAVLKVPVGTSFSECLDACGGGDLARFKVIDGGPMMGTVLSGPEAGSKYVTKTTSGIVVIPDSGNFDARAHDTAVEKMLNRAKSACIQCSFCTELCPRRLIGHPLRPHKVMRRMASMDFGAPALDDPALGEALICCECGVCETFACPMGLSPRQVNKYVKKLLAGLRRPKPEAPSAPEEMRKYRKIAPLKIMARMGLYGLYGKKAETFLELSPDRVRIPVKQHIGAPARPVVRAGDEVAPGQLVAEADGRVSANIHASIAGVVTEAGNFITIEK
ncbi:MAG: SLBB domain-containing protein [Synergistaceae bacterium]|nr:SLBB domain-containing protein [Synergistaceae bacterium]